MNAILVIHPYKFHGQWVFDDPTVGLNKEPFVSGADTMLDRLTEDIADAGQGVTVLFSSRAFPGYQHEVARVREEFGGNWYRSEQFGLEGWLCPALFKYFAEAPETLYLQVKPIKHDAV
jgi:hypothetical protein